MKEHILERTIGEYGIFHFIVLDTYNVVNLSTKEIMPRMNFFSIEDAEDYISELV